MAKKYYSAVAGTNARESYVGDERWFERGSLFDRLIGSRGYERIEQDGDPTKKDPGWWSGEIQGMFYQDISRWFQSFKREKPQDWDIGAYALSTFIKANADKWRDENASVTIIAHSHGGQVACLALSRLQTYDLGFPIHLITVDLPVRRNLSPAYKAAGRKVDYWTHCYSSKMNPWRLFGSRFGPRECQYAHSNIQIRGGHSNILVDPVYIDQVIDLL